MRIQPRQAMHELQEQRRRLVERQLKGRGIADPAVLAAFADVRREAFLPSEMAEFAYLDTALPIEKGQTISQPYIVALMAEALELKPTDRVLEVGTGSGYAAAVLAALLAKCTQSSGTRNWPRLRPADSRTRASPTST